MADGIIVYTNPPFDSLFGYARSELLGKHVAVLNAPTESADPDQTAAEIGRFLKERNEWSGTLANIRKDGTQFWSHASVTSFNHEVFGKAWVATHRDITEKRKTQHALRESRQQIQVVLDSSRDIICMRDMATGEFTYWNRALTDITGFTTAEMAELGFEGTYNRMHPDEIAAFLRYYEDVLAGRDTRRPIEYRWKIKSGEYRWFSDSLSLIRDDDGRPLTMVHITRDITAQKQADANLTLFKTLVESSGQAIAVSDLSGKLLYINPAHERLFGYTLAEAQDLNYRSYYPPESVEVLDGVVAPALARGETWESELRVHDSSGRVFWLWESAGPVRNADGTVITCYGIMADVTARKQAEESLRESEKLFREVLNNSNDAIFLLERNEAGPGRYLLVNDRAVAMLGYSREELLKMSPHDIVPPKKMNSTMPGVIERLKREGHATFESFHRRKDGSTYPVEVSTRTFTYRGICVDLSSIRDITKRRQAEEALRESEERFRSIVENANDIITLVNAEGVFTYVSPNVLGIFGYGPEDVIGKPAESFIHPDDAAKADAQFQRIMQDGVPITGREFRVRCKDGTYRFISQNVAAIRDSTGAIVAGVAIARDITQVREAARALAESEARYRAIFSAEMDALFVIDRATRIILDCNDAALMMYRFAKAELAGRPITTVSGEPERTDEAIGELQRFVPLRLHRRSDGSEFPVEIMMDTIDLQGRTVIVAAVRDITERRRNEAALRKANYQLKLLSSITRHDIRNQMLALSSYISLAAQSLEDTSRAAEFLENARVVSGEISRHIQFTREYQEIGSGETSWMDLGTLLPADRVPEGISFRQDIHGVEIYADPLLEKVFFNLLDNSCRHGERITEIRVSSGVEDGTLLVLWEDDGIGIPTDDKDRIFEQGFGKNTGLGMFLAREILALTDITIHENGVPGKGARFEIRVPPGTWRKWAP